MARRKLTPFQKIMRASKRDTGLWLSEDNVFTLSIMSAIIDIAQEDDENDLMELEAKELTKELTKEQS